MDYDKRIAQREALFEQERRVDEIYYMDLLNRWESDRIREQKFRYVGSEEYRGIRWHEANNKWNQTNEERQVVLAALNEKKANEIAHLENEKAEKIEKMKESLKNSTVKVKGKVVKFNAGIMNRNWIHIQDGTGDESGYDLLVTSDDFAEVGDIIICEGTLTLDKDFGAGYYYSVVLEKSKVSKGL